MSKNNKNTIKHYYLCTAIEKYIFLFETYNIDKEGTKYIIKTDCTEQENCYIRTTGCRITGNSKLTRITRRK